MAYDEGHTLENRNAMQRVFRSTVEGLIVGSWETRQKVGFKTKAQRTRG